MSKKKKTSLTNKQRKFLDIFSENIGNKGETKSLYQMLKEAGYSESVAKQQTTILETQGIQENLDDIVGKLEKHRERVIERMGDTIDKAQYRDLTNSLHKLNKDIELLSGRSTERVDTGNFKELSRNELKKIIEEGESGDGEEGAGE